ncbi:bifunctional transcriptional activator/DNA repair enzyme AdaA [Sphingobacterium hungaricum]
MSTQDSINYNRIAAAIDFIQQHFKEQPSLERIAEQVHLSPMHFQRLFTDWAGTSPKKFLQYISVEHAKRLLSEQQATLFDAAYETGLSGTGRLHDLFVSIEGMTPAEYKHAGKSLTIHYHFADSLFGSLLVANTSKGICYLAFYEDKDYALTQLKAKFPNAIFDEKEESMQQDALAIFQQDGKPLPELKLHLKGTDFQLKVWESLLKIPTGKLSTYGTLAAQIGHPEASRAVGTAIGSNPVAFLIPCHRVIQNSGLLGGYRWGTTRKTAIIGWENAQANAQDGII